MNTQAFIYMMKDRGWSQTTLAAAIGISRTRLCAKIHQWNGAVFNLNEISAIKRVLALSMTDIECLFFGGEQIETD